MSIPEFEFKGAPLTEETTGTITSFILNPESEKELSEDELLKDSFYMQMILKRFEAYNLKYKITNFFFVSSLSTFVDSPAKVMLLLWLTHQYWKKAGKELMGIGEWCGMFPMGAPTDDELHVMWDSQKDSEHNNMLDDPQYWV